MSEENMELKIKGEIKMTVDQFTVYVKSNLSDGSSPDEFDKMLVQFFISYLSNMSLERHYNFCKEFTDKIDEKGWINHDNN